MGQKDSKLSCVKSVVLLSLENMLNAFMVESTRRLCDCWEKKSEITLPRVSGISCLEP